MLLKHDSCLLALPSTYVHFQQFMQAYCLLENSYDCAKLFCLCREHILLLKKSKKSSILS